MVERRFRGSGRLWRRRWTASLPPWTPGTGRRWRLSFPRRCGRRTGRHHGAADVLLDSVAGELLQDTDPQHQHPQNKGVPGEDPELIRPERQALDEAVNGLFAALDARDGEAVAALFSPEVREKDEDLEEQRESPSRHSKRRSIPPP